MDRPWLILIVLSLALLGCQQNESQAPKEVIPPVVELSKVPADFFNDPQKDSRQGKT